jgi:hypothetical protein
MTISRKKNRLWVWYFVFIVIASASLAGFMIAFNLHLQLKPEQLAAAQQQWREQGPADYMMTYTKKLGAGDHVDAFVVKVRARKVVDVRMNGEPLRDSEGVPIVDERLQYHSMDRLLRDIERFLELDAKAGKKYYNMAIFDEQSGALKRYVRSVRETGEHVEEDVRVEPLP